MKLLLRNSFEVSTKEIIFRMRNIFVGNSSTLRKKKQKRKQKKSSEIKSGLDLGSTDLDTKKSPGNAGPTLASLKYFLNQIKSKVLIYVKYVDK